MYSERCLQRIAVCRKAIRGMVPAMVMLRHTIRQSTPNEPICQYADQKYNQRFLIAYVGPKIGTLWCQRLEYIQDASWRLATLQGQRLGPF